MSPFTAMRTNSFSGSVLLDADLAFCHTVDLKGKAACSDECTHNLEGGFVIHHYESCYKPVT